MKNGYEAGDVSLTKAELRNTSKSIDLLAQIVEMSIYEDICQPTVMVELTLIDSLNLVESFPIVGEEKLIVYFNTPGVEQQSKYTFSIYSVENTSAYPSARASVYILRGVTPIHITNAVTFVEKAYKDSISNIASDVFTNLVKSTKGFDKDIYIEPTKGITPIVMPSSHPLEILDMLRQRAISASQKTGGAYVFFETQSKFNFRSLQDLIKKSGEEYEASGVIRRYTYGNNADTLRSSSDATNIINFNYITKFDSITKLIGGGLNTQVETFDMLQKNTAVTEFNFQSQNKAFSSLDKTFILGNSESFISEYSSKNAVRYFNVKDSSTGDNYISDFMPMASAYSTLFDQNILRILIHGNSGLEAGDVVNIDMPSLKGTTGAVLSDRYYQDNFLTVRLRHTFRLEGGMRTKHLISMDCAKIGVFNDIKVSGA